MPEQYAAARLPLIAVLATGGTIAGAQPSAKPAAATQPTRAKAAGARAADFEEAESSAAEVTAADAAGTAVNYVAGTFTVQQLLQGVPQLAGFARLLPEQVANVGSQDMSHAIWHALATRVLALLQDDAVDGIVITHGTDTLEETAWFLSLVLPRTKPVVLLGAMRPADALSADGPRNLYHAVLTAASGLAGDRGPLVLMNEDIHGARDVQKMACTGVAAFASPNHGRAGTIRAGRPVFHYAPAAQASRAARFPLAALPAVASWPNVAVLYDHVGAQADVAQFITARCAGVVLAGVGDGNTSAAVARVLAQAAASGIAVVRATRTGSGHVARNIELDDDTLGFIAAGDLNPQKARVLLMLALTVTRDRQELQRIFESS